jgi:rRNA maturation RNase YbeY
LSAETNVKAFKRLSVKAAANAPAATLQRLDAPTIIVANRQRAKSLNSRLLKNLVAALLSELKINHAELSIQLVGARQMARLNWRFLRHEGSTDVLTFNYGHSPLQMHGELVVCVDDAVKQAAEFHTTWQSEVVRYVVHGVLHLLGYDDLTPVARRQLKRLENRLVQRLALRFSFAFLSRNDSVQPQMDTDEHRCLTTKNAENAKGKGLVSVLFVFFVVKCFAYLCPSVSICG